MKLIIIMNKVVFIYDIEIIIELNFIIGKKNVLKIIFIIIMILIVIFIIY